MSQTPRKRVLFGYIPRTALLGVFGALSFLVLNLVVLPNKTIAATQSSTINFQARLLNGAGAVAPDGTYNVEFKLYSSSTPGVSAQGTCAGDPTCLWVEDYTSANAQVSVTDGYLSVSLGSHTAFPNTINWNQNLWLGMNIGGTGASPIWDGQMTPLLPLTAVPFSLKAQSLALTNGNNTATLNFTAPTQNDTIVLPDASGTVCLNLAAACGFATGNGVAVLLQGTTPGSAQTGNINITGTVIAGNVQAGGIDTAAAGTLTVGQTNATSVTIDQSTTIASGKALTITGSGAFPSSPTEGELYYRTDLHQLYIYENGAWKTYTSGSTVIVADASTSSNPQAASYIVPAGSTSAQTTINTAINSIPNGGTVILLDGTYNVSDSINLPSNINLVGVGESTIITPTASFSDTNGIIDNSNQSNGNNHISVQNLKLNGSAVTATNVPGINVAASSGTRGNNANTMNIFITGVDIQNLLDYEVFIGTAYSATITNSSFTFVSGSYGGSGGYAISGSNTNDILISNNVFNFAGINTLANSSAVSNNSINSAPTTAINANAQYNYTDYITINKNYISSAVGTGIQVGSAYNVSPVIDGNNIISSGLYGIYATNTTDMPRITNNTIKTTVNNAIYLSSTPYANVSSNFIQTTTGNGAASGQGIVTTGTANTIENNQVSNTYFSGIDASSGANDTISGNVVLGANQAQTGCEFVFAWCSETVPGILINGLTQSTISGNTVSGTLGDSGQSPVYGSAGIMDFNGSYNSINGNSSSGNSRYGISTVGVSHDTISNNTLSTPSAKNNEGIVLSYFSTYNQVSNNTDYGSYDFCIGDYAGSYNQFTGNNVSNCGYEGYVDSSSVLGSYVSYDDSFIGNTTANDGTVGFYFKGGWGNGENYDTVVSDNTIYNPVSQGGILTDGGDVYGNYTNNSIYSNNGLPGLIFNSSSNNNVSGNIYYGTANPFIQNNSSTNNMDNQVMNASTGPVFENQNANSANAFQVQSSSGTNILNVDTTNGQFGSNMASPGTLTMGTASGGGLTASTTYYYEVTALGPQAGETSPSPENSIATTSSNLSITISWTAVPGAIGYKVYRGTSSGGENVYYFTTSTSFTDTGAASTSGTPPILNTSYINRISTAGNSLIGGGDLGVGSSAPVATLQVGTTTNTTLEVNNTTTQVSINVPYSIDENQSASPAGTLNDSATYVPGQYTRLNPASAGTDGEVAYTFTPTNPNLDTSFDFWAGGGGGADSTYFYAYNTSIPTTEGTAAGGYVVALDEYLGQIELFWNGSVLTNVSMANIANSTWRTVNVNITSTGLITVAVNGTVMLSYQDSVRSLTGTKFGFGGRSGGITDEHRVRSMYMQFVPNQTFSVNGTEQVKTSTNSTSAFNVQNAAGSNVLNVDTTNQRVVVGSTGTAVGQLYVSGSTPTSIYGNVSLGTTAVENYSHAIAVQGRYAYVVDGTTTLSVYDISTPSSPSTPIGTYTNSFGYLMRSITIDGQYAYVGAQKSALSPMVLVFNIANPANPVYVSTSFVAGLSSSPVQSIYSDGKYLYTVTSSGSGVNELQIYDLSSPTSLSSVAILNLGNNLGSNSIYVQGKYVYIVNKSTSTFEVVDLSIINHPTVTSTVSLPANSNPNDVYVVNRYAYIATGSGSLLVYDVSNPSSISSVGSVVLSATGNSLSVQGREVYVVEDGYMQTIDISTPSSPTVVGTYTDASNAHFNGLVIQGRYAYTVDTQNSKLDVLDIGGAYIQQLQAGGIETGILQVNGNANVSGDTTLQGSLSVGQSLNVNGNAAFGSIKTAGLATPGAPGVATVGTTGSTSYSYAVVAFNSSGTSAISTQTKITNGNAILSGSNYNQITISTVGNAVGYNIWRANTGSYSYGFIGTVYSNYNSTLTFNDTGLPGDGSFYSSTTQTAGSLYVGGSATFSDQGASATAFQIQNTGGTSSYLSVNSIDNQITIGTSEASLAIPGLSASPSMTAGSLAANTWYFKITAVDNYGGETPSSSEVGPVTTDASHTSIQLTVSGLSAGDVAYKVYYGNISGNESAFFYIDTTSFIWTGSNVAGVAGAPPSSSSTDTAYTTNVFSPSTRSVVIGSGGDPTGSLFVSGGTGLSNKITYGPVNGSAGFTAIAVSGHFVYATGSSNTLYVYDVTNPDVITQVSTLSLGSGSPYGMTIQGNYAYIINNTSGALKVVNISNPFAPVLVATSTTTVTGAYSVVVAGKYAYVIGASGGLRIYDITNPKNPTALGQVGNNYYHEALQGNYLYVTDANNNTMYVINVSNPISPSVVGSITTTYATGGVAVSGKYAYVSEIQGGDTDSSMIQTIDISNPASPSNYGSAQGAGYDDYELQIQGHMLYVGDSGWSGLESMDITNPSDMKWEGVSQTGMNSLDSAYVISGRYAYSFSFSQIDVIDLDGEYAQQLEAGSTETGSLQVDGNSNFTGNASLQGSLTVGASTELQGPVAISGQTTIQNLTNATNAFQVQNATGTSVLSVDTTNSQVTVAGSGTLSNAALNITGGSIYIPYGTGIFTPGYSNTTLISSNWTGSRDLTTIGVPGNNNNPGLWLNSPAVGVNNSNPTYNLDIAGATGERLQTTTNTATAFQVQNAASGQIFNISTTTGSVTVNAADTQGLGSWTTQGSGPNSDAFGTVVANGYMYSLGGFLFYTQVAPINANGTVGTWSVINTAVPTNPGWTRAFYANGYIYAIFSAASGPAAGHTATYYARVLPNGGLGSWQLSPNYISTSLGAFSAVEYNNYLYVVGGYAGGGQTAVYYAPIYANGGVGVWNTTTALPSGTNDGWAIAANGYIYEKGYSATILSDSINANGTLGGTWATAGTLPTCLNDDAAAILNGYLYDMGGQTCSTTYSSGVYESPLVSGGTLGSWTTTTSLPAALDYVTSATANGYLYVLGGYNGSSNSSNVYSNSVPRLQVGEGIDLVGITGQSLASSGDASLGSSAGTLSAGNTWIDGTLSVQGQASFSQGINTQGSLSVSNTAFFADTTDTPTAFQIQNASGSSIVNIDTSNTRVDLISLNSPGTITAMQPPATPTVSTFGTAGSSSYQYEVTALSANGAETAAAVGSISTGNATLNGSNYNQISWTAVTGAVLYNVYRSSGPGGYTLGLIGSTTGTSLNDQGATAGAYYPSAATSGTLSTSTTYYYEVTALDANGGETAPSNQTNFTTSASYKTITVSWAPVTGAKTYRVYRSTTSGSFTGVPFFSTNTNSFTDTGGGATGTPPVTTSGYVNNITASNNASLTVGANGTSTAQLYVGGSIPAAALTTINTYGSVTGTFVLGRYLYEVTENATLQIFDVSNPANPIKLNGTNGTALNQSGGQPRIYVAGHYAYITEIQGADTDTGYLQIFDVSNPSNPTSIAITSTGLGDDPAGIYVQGRYAYTIDPSTSSFSVIDVSNPASPTWINSFSVTYGAYSLYVQANLLYVVGYNGLAIYNVSNPVTSVPLVGVLTGIATSSTNNSVYVQGRYAYIAAGSSKFDIIDVANPANPVLASTTTVGSSTLMTPIVQGRYAYIINANAGSSLLYVYDVSNPYGPIQLGSVNGGNSPNAMYVSGRYAYVGDWNTSTINVYDLGGGYIQQLQTGDIETATLQTEGDVTVNGDQYIQGGLSIGTSLGVQGNAGFSGYFLQRNQTNSTSSFQIQNSSSVPILSVDTTNSQVVIGSTTNGITLSASSGLTAFGSARHLKTIVLSPVYANSVLDPNGAVNDIGTMTNGFDSTQRESYYNWTTSQISANVYDVVISYWVPSDWSNWATSNSISIQTWSDNLTNSTGTLTVKGTTGSTDINAGSITPASTSTWTTTNFTQTNGYYAANGMMTIRVHMSSNTNSNFKIGQITLKYYSAF